MKIGKSNSLSRQSVDVRRRKALRAINTDIRIAQVIRQNQHDVRLSRVLGPERSDGRLSTTDKCTVWSILSSALIKRLAGVLENKMSDVRTTSGIMHIQPFGGC